MAGSKGTLPYEGAYYTFREYCRNTYGEPLYKISLNIGCTCPNRDGTAGTGGCTFCGAAGAGEFAGDASRPVAEQLRSGKEQARRIRPKIRRYIAYFQAFTNTYGDPAYLRSCYLEAAADPDVTALCIATRPDCCGDEVIALLQEVSLIKPVTVELGLQTVHDDTAERFHRGYPTSVFEDAIGRLSRAGIPVVVHLMLGLPGESEEDFLQTVRTVSRLPVTGVKFHLLYLLRGTALAEEMPADRLLTEEEYLTWLGDGIALLRPDISVQRVTGDPPKELLLGPGWCLRKAQVLNDIRHSLKVRGIRQGCRFESPADGQKG
ncbi:MAG: TIGR01212 family radical SAM protein [Lachnospiraceae bacterium]|nr:TIGR01212 family radical SAM protein [Lachnospiraceae bacterium]MBQ9592929.1 TIGR01212 family radical SAM protein [Lachnospiraceae bacterium]